jgi:hypothetical protein
MLTKKLALAQNSDYTMLIENHNSGSRNTKNVHCLRSRWNTIDTTIQIVNFLVPEILLTSEHPSAEDEG